MASADTVPVAEPAASIGARSSVTVVLVRKQAHGPERINASQGVLFRDQGWRRSRQGAWVELSWQAGRLGVAHLGRFCGKHRGRG